MNKYGLETRCIHGGYKAERGQAQVPPIVQSTTYRYYSSEDMAKLFNLEIADFMYSRLGNPTVGVFENKMAELEGGTAAIATSSGQSALLITILNICKNGDHIISSSSIYGGSFNLLKVRLNDMGIDVTFVDQNADLEELKKAIKPNTKLIFAETLANPAMTILDFEKFRALADAAQVPLAVDNTLASPYLCNPIKHGADLVLHSTTKWIDGHATAVGGVVVEAGTFDWEAHKDKYPMMVEADDSYHGLKFYETFGNMAFSVKLRAHMLRDFGCTMSPQNAFLSIQGLDTLHLRMERHSENALKVAQFLENHPKVEWVNYPGLEGHESKELCDKYLPKGASGVIAFGVKGGKAEGEKLLEALELASMVVHVGDIRTSVLHPASTTHRQLTEEEQIKSGVRPEMIRLSVGCESFEDIKNDFNKALEAI